MNASVYSVPAVGSGGFVLAGAPVNRQGLWTAAQGSVVPAAASDSVTASGVHAGATVTLLVTEQDGSKSTRIGNVSADGSQIQWA